MKYLIIPDVHDKVNLVDRILDQEGSWDQLVFLGDFFDDFSTGAKEARQTAERVKKWLDEAVCLLGNHDVPYGWMRPEYLCSGNTYEKAKVINEILKTEDWDKFRLHCWVEDLTGETWLLTHAGLHSAHVSPSSDLLKVQVDTLLQNTLHDLKGGRRTKLLGAGWDRGGSQEYGGVTWCDFRQLVPVPGLNQICGHTPYTEVRIKTINESHQIVCLDTHLRHYAVIEDSSLSIRETPIA